MLWLESILSEILLTLNKYMKRNRFQQKQKKQITPNFMGNTVNSCQQLLAVHAR